MLSDMVETFPQLSSRKFMNAVSGEDCRGAFVAGDRKWFARSKLLSAEVGALQSSRSGLRGVTRPSTTKP